MMATLNRLWTQLREYLGRMSGRRRIISAILAVAIIVLAIVAAVYLSRTNYVPLITAQTQAEAGVIYAALDERGIPARVEGNTVLVPEERVGELSAVLSADGVMGPSSIDLGVMSLAANFNVTDSHAKKLYEYQRASDIRTSILQSDRIQNAIVIVNLGQISAYARPRDVNQPTASVMLSVRGGAMLSEAEVRAIADTVRGAIPGITYENISIIDDNLSTYRVSEEAIEPELDLNSRLMLQSLLARQMEGQVEQLLTPIFGMSNVRVAVRVGLNFDRVVIESVVFDPPVPGELEGIARSSHDLWEAVRSTDIAEGIPGTDSNAMGTVEYPYGTLDDNDLFMRMIRERNYEINETRTLIEREQGKIETINIMVTLNNKDMDEDYTAEIITLISKGVGIPLSNIDVLSAPFDHKDTALQGMFDDWMRWEEQTRQRELLKMIITGAVILLLGIAAITLVGMIYKGTRPIPEPEPVLVDGGGGMYDFTVSDDYDDEDLDDLPEEIEIDMQKKSAGLEQIERFIDKDPGAVAQLLRNWLTDE